MLYFHSCLGSCCCFPLVSVPFFFGCIWGCYVFVSVSELERQETVFVGSRTVLFFFTGVLFCVCHLSNDESAEWEVAYTVEKACCLSLFGVIFNI